MSKRLGGLRPSQIITSFGPGSIVDLSKDSVMILGTDSWPISDPVHEYRLEQLLGVEMFRSPGTGPREGIPVRSFPKWRVCPKCGAISDRFPRQPGRTVPTCNRCKFDAETHPARFIMACSGGHVSDFPWVRWTHRGRLICEVPLLTLRTKARTGALSDLEVVCSCGARQSMYGSLGVGLSRVVNECPGHRPWLGDTVSDCSSQVRGLQRGASNAYFPSIFSGLSIPPFVGRVQRTLDTHWPTISKLAEIGPDQVEMLIKALFPTDDLEEVRAAIRLRLSRESKTDLRLEEWLVLRAGGATSEDFDTREAVVPEHFRPWIERVVLVRRLREVRVLMGFTRVDPPDPESGDRKRLAPLAAERQNWLPAVEVRGEGLFIELRKDAVEKWEALEEVKSRAGRVLRAYAQWRTESGWPEEQMSPRHVLVHTLSHLMIKQLALDAGYSSASIRERLYLSPSMCGFLLYTAAPGADGSLGGLIQQGDPARLSTLLAGALETAAVCSSDPLCREHAPSTHAGVNGAACHACALAPETACEKGNRLLDRGCVIDLPGVPAAGYFSRRLE